MTGRRSASAGGGDSPGARADSADRRLMPGAIAVSRVSGIGVVVNPRAGRNRRADERADRLGDVLGGQGWVRETASLAHLDDVAAECRARAIDVLGVCGGDGTLARTLSALVRVYGSDALPRILPLRAGTMNTVARAMGCSALAARAHAGRDRRRATAAAGRSTRPSTNCCGSTATTSASWSAPACRSSSCASTTTSRSAALRGAARGAGAAESARRVRRGALARGVFQPMEAALTATASGVPFAAYRHLRQHASRTSGSASGRPIGPASARARSTSSPARSAPPSSCAACRRSGAAGRRGSPRCTTSWRRALHVEFRDPTFYMIDGDIMEPARASRRSRTGPVVRVIRR